MLISSLGHRTDVALRRLGGSVVDDGGDHLVVRSAANPGFYWGNYVLVGEQADARDVGRWTAVFASAFPVAEHLAIGVDGDEPDAGVVAAWREVATVYEHVVLSASAGAQAAEPLRSVDADLRSLVTGADWAALAVLDGLGDEGLEPDDDVNRLFLQRRAAEKRGLVRDGAARWFGAFVGGELVSTLGLVVADGLGRYQDVTTHPDFRRRGLAGALVREAARWAAHERGVDRLVIVADPDERAIGLYRGLGFADVGRQMQLLRRRVGT